MTFSSDTHHSLDAVDTAATEALPGGHTTRLDINPGTPSPLAGHLAKVDGHLDDGNFDCAARELESAAERLMTYQSMVSSSMEATLTQLTAQGCHAAVPHPKALQLVRFKQKL